MDEEVRIERRSFLKGVAAGAAMGGIVAAGGVFLATSKIMSEEILGVPKRWDHEADVVVIGSGLSGLSTAITAHDKGAEVIILEKLGEEGEGGNSKVSGNLWWAPTDVSEGIKYIRAMSLGTIGEDIIELLAEEMYMNNDWVRELGGDPEDISDLYVTEPMAPEYPSLPGSSCVRLYSLEGEVGKGLLWNLIRSNVEARGIEVMYETPARELIQNPKTKEILGVKVERLGMEALIRARRAVVLACGGFEFNFEMQRDYLPGWPIYGFGTPGNTGDGITMAQKVGAALWHMNNPMGPIGGALIVPDYPEMPIWATYPSFNPGRSFILVDKSGRRFMNELRETRHGFGHRELILDFDGLECDFLRIPHYMIFDESTRVRGPMIIIEHFKMTWFKWQSDYVWSEDNSVEIDKGWITKADTIVELAAKTGLDPEVLEDTIRRYNQCCEEGIDPEFNRSYVWLKPIETPPFYSMEIWPGMVNTQGGPKRDVNCQVVDPKENPIPRLYAIGECGSFWGWMYNGGGNQAECMVTGRIAGRNAAAEKPWDLDTPL